MYQYNDNFSIFPGQSSSNFPSSANGSDSAEVIRSYQHDAPINGYGFLTTEEAAEQRLKAEPLIKELKVITQRYLDDLKAIHDGLLMTDASSEDCDIVRGKYQLVSELMGYLNQWELGNFIQHLIHNKDTIAAHRTPDWQRFMDAVLLTIAVAALATSVAFCFEINVVTAIVSALVGLVALLAVQRKIETNSFNFFASHGAIFANEAERLTNRI